MNEEMIKEIAEFVAPGTVRLLICALDEDGDQYPKWPQPNEDDPLTVDMLNIGEWGWRACYRPREYTHGLPLDNYSCHVVCPDWLGNTDAALSLLDRFERGYEIQRIPENAERTRWEYRITGFYTMKKLTGHTKSSNYYCGPVGRTLVEAAIETWLGFMKEGK